MNFCKISEQNFAEWLSMGLALWPRHTKEALAKEFQMELEKSFKYEHFLAQDENGDYLGFVNLSIRTDHVDGASSSPVGYVEGIFVKPKYRKQGVAKKLVQQAEKWAKEQGCKELASDAELSNIVSQKFHASVGFEKSKTTVHFIKPINS